MIKRRMRERGRCESLGATGADLPRHLPAAGYGGDYLEALFDQRRLTVSLLETPVDCIALADALVAAILALALLSLPGIVF